MNLTLHDVLHVDDSKIQLLDSLESFEVSAGTESECARSRAYKKVPRLQHPEDIDTLHREYRALR